jgi:hypothetical protein
MTCASVVFPSPGGPCSSVCSTGSLRARAASHGDPQLADQRLLPDVLLELLRPQRVVEAILFLPSASPETMRSRGMTTVLAMDMIITSIKPSASAASAFRRRHEQFVKHRPRLNVNAVLINAAELASQCGNHRIEELRGIERPRPCSPVLPSDEL